LEIYWEISGVPSYDILVSGITAGWTLPVGELMGAAKQFELLSRLREFLAKIGLKTNIDLPSDLTEDDASCMWSGCERRRLHNRMVCRHHFDLGFLSNDARLDPTLSSGTPPAGQEPRHP
jgi:hypothetical protein